MTRHHPKHPEHPRQEPESATAWGMVMVVFVGVLLVSIAMVAHTSRGFMHRSQEHVIAAPAPKTPEVMMRELVERDVPVELKPSVELPVEAPVAAPAIASDAPAAIEPSVEAQTAQASPEAPQRLVTRHRRAHYHHRRRHHRRHHVSKFCLSPRPDGLEPATFGGWFIQ